MSSRFTAVARRCSSEPMTAAKGGEQKLICTGWEGPLRRARTWQRDVPTEYRTLVVHQNQNE
jgi:hypothetical protein